MLLVAVKRRVEITTNPSTTRSLELDKARVKSKTRAANREAAAVASSAFGFTDPPRNSIIGVIAKNAPSIANREWRSCDTEAKVKPIIMAHSRAFTPRIE
jgi:hypothetical protein